MQAGVPMAKQEIYFNPVLDLPLGEPRFQDTTSSRTDAEGRFKFERLPPIVGAVRTQLGPWEDSTLTSGPSMPLDLEPGKERVIELGGGGAAITERIIARGRTMRR